MRPKLVTAGLVALALSAWSVSACIVEGVVSCPNDTAFAGIRVYIVGGASTVTSEKGVYMLTVPAPGQYTVCVDLSTVPQGLNIQGQECKDITADVLDIAIANFKLNGPLCKPPQTPGLCWLTGGGTIGTTKGVPDYSYGGVVNPGCSPDAAGGGNWNVVDHLNNLHFQGLFIHVIECSGVSDKAPKVNVNIIDFEGVGILKGIAGNPMAETAVNFRARAEDHGEPGAGADRLYLNVTDAVSGNSLLLISTGGTVPTDTVEVSTGNLQIHTTGCDK